MIGRWLRSDTGLAWVLGTFAVLIGLLAVAVVWTVLNGQRALDDIRASRHELCVDQNHRHGLTVRRLDAEIAALPPVARVQALSRRAATVALIDALSPARDCDTAFPNP